MLLYANSIEGGVLNRIVGNVVDYGELSTDIPVAKTIIIKGVVNAQHTITINDTYGINDNSNFCLIENVAGDAIKSTNPTTITPIDIDGVYYIHLHIVFESSDYANHEAILNISDGITNNEISLLCETVAPLDNIETKLQNKRINIDSDWYKGFYQSKLYPLTNTDQSTTLHEITKVNYGFKDVDHVLMNRKKREFLLNWFDITGFIGSYKSLYTVLNYFGYGDLLSIKEYWKNTLDGRLSQSSITNKVWDKSLIRSEKIYTMKDFIKTNEISLNYKINEYSGVDDPDDGLPIFVNILFNTDLVLTKMYAIKRVLENNAFISSNVTISDIIGEFDAVVGLNLRHIENSLTWNNVRVFQNQYGDKPTITVDNPTKTVERHVILKKDSLLEYNIFSDELDIVSGATQLIVKNDIFFIERQFDSLDNVDMLNDFDILRKFDNSTFALFKYTFNVDSNTYFGIKIRVVDTITNDILIQTDRIPISDIDNWSILGIRKIGTFKVTFILFDYYGGVDFIDNNDLLTVLDREASFKIGTHNIDTYINNGTYTVNDFIRKDLAFFSNIETTNESTVDYIYYDPFDAIGESIVAGYTSKDFDMKTTLTYGTEIAKISGNLIKELIPLESGYTYAVYIVDVLDYNNTAGYNGLNRTVNLKNRYFSWRDYDEFTYTNAIGSDDYFVTQLASELNKITSGTLSDYTYNLTYYNGQSNVLSDGKPYLMIKSVKEAKTTQNIDLVINGNNSVEFTRFDKDNLFITDFDTYINADVSIGGISDLIITYYDKDNETTDTITVTDVEINNTLDAYNEITNVLNTLSENNRSRIRVSQFLDYKTTNINVTSRDDITITHVASFGTLKDVSRSHTWSNIIALKDGSDYNLGQSLFAFIPNDAYKNELKDIEWKLLDSNNNVVTTQKSNVLKHVFIKQGVYSIELSYRDSFSLQFNNDKKVVTKFGCCLVGV